MFRNGQVEIENYSGTFVSFRLSIVNSARRRAMAMTTGSNNGISAEMNVTPMIDILLVLLVIFMIIVPLEHGEMAEIPQPNNSTTPQKQDEANVVIQIMQGGSGGQPHLKINKDAVPWDKLE